MYTTRVNPKPDTKEYRSHDSIPVMSRIGKTSQGDSSEKGCLGSGRGEGHRELSELTGRFCYLQMSVIT